MGSIGPSTKGQQVREGELRLQLTAKEVTKAKEVEGNRGRWRMGK